MPGFLPDDYVIPTADNGYMKFEQGDNTFRVISNAIVGYETWIDKKKEDGSMGRYPVRAKDSVLLQARLKKMNAVGAQYDMKPFWAFLVWNYNANGIQILELTQKGIMRSLQSLHKSDKWGDIKGYDVTVTREGEGLDTEYTVMPNPHTELDKDISKAKDINLEALYTGDDPFSGESENLTDEEFKEFLESE